MGADTSLRDRLIAVAGDRYVIDDELGRGGMAVVFAATDVRLKRAVAIKALPPELAFRADVRSRFMREAQMAAALSHANIVPIYAVDDSDSLVYMVMGRVRGESLAQRLHREGALPFADTRRILRETADALAHAHAHGVIHRDIKPDNILLDEKTGRVLVTDFGIARALEGDARITVTGVAVGTPTYMSPEQARGDDDVDGRADVYALGVVGFQMLAGAPPFNAPNTPALLLKHVSEPPPPLATRRADVPPSLAYAVERALAKDRNARWPNATAMREALADDAPAPPSAVRNALEARPAQRVRPVPAPLPPARASQWPTPAPLPPYPAYRGTTSEDRARWREAQKEWRERVREQQHALQDEVRNRRDLAREVRRAGRNRPSKDAPLSTRIKAFQGHVVSNVFIMFMLFLINAATGGFPWFIFPAVGMSIGIAVHALSLWQDGVRFRDFFRRPSSFPSVASASIDADPATIVEARARQLVGSDVMVGPHAEVVRRAAADEKAVQDILKSLAPSDRSQLPDVGPTLQSLVERVASLAQALHRLDADLRPEQLSHLDARLSEAKRLPEGSPDRDRRVSLLERQRASLSELSTRRTTLAEQLESASLVLQTMRLDLLRLRSAGIGNAAADVNSATQEARALSHDIGRVLDAAAEVRKL